MELPLGDFRLGSATWNLSLVNSILRLLTFTRDISPWNFAWELPHDDVHYETVAWRISFGVFGLESLTWDSRLWIFGLGSLAWDLGLVIFGL